MDARASPGNPIPVDEQLRANPDDLVALMRAGRLSRERVAMAAYLGDERAAATGVEPWVPVYSDWTHRSGPAPLSWEVVGFGELTKRQRVWLAAICAERALEHFPRLREDQVWSHLLKLARAWCRSEGSDAERQAASLAAPAEADQFEAAGFTPNQEAAAWSAVQVLEATLPYEDLRSRTLEAVASAIAARSHEDKRDAEQAWQAQAMAAVLLDPTWPPWEE